MDWSVLHFTGISIWFTDSLLAYHNYRSRLLDSSSLTTLVFVSKLIIAFYIQLVAIIPFMRNMFETIPAGLRRLQHNRNWIKSLCSRFLSHLHSIYTHLQPRVVNPIVLKPCKHSLFPCARARKAYWQYWMANNDSNDCTSTTRSNPGDLTLLQCLVWSIHQATTDCIDYFHHNAYVKLRPNKPHVILHTARP